MKNFPLLILLIVSVRINAQILTPSDYNAGGTEKSEANFSLSYSIGGMLTNTLDDNSFILTQGFQQGSDLLTGLVNYTTGNGIQIRVFPNPTQDFIHITLLNIDNPAKCRIEIFDETGRVFTSSKEYFEFRNSENITLDVTNLMKGAYTVILMLKESNTRFACFQLIKMQ